MYKYILTTLLSITHLIALSVFDINITTNIAITDKFTKILNELDSSNSVQKDFDDDECPLKIFNDDEDRDGVEDNFDMCPNTICDLEVNYEGCSKKNIYDYDGDGVFNNIDKCPHTLKGFKIDWENGCPVSSNISILFRIFSDKISKHSLNNLRDFAKLAIQNYNSHVVLRLNAYHKYGEKYEEILLHQREDKLIYLLQILGISSNRIYIEDIIPQESNLSSEILRNNREINLYLDYPNYKEDDKDRDGILDSLDECPNTDEYKKIDDLGCPLDEAELDIHFEINSLEINQHFINSLKNFTDYFLENNNDELYISGYADNQEINPIDLSYQRAKIIKKKLIEFGISEYIITTSYYGYTKPIKQNITSKDKAQNRRVEVRTKFKNDIGEYWEDRMNNFNQFIF